MNLYSKVVGTKNIESWLAKNTRGADINMAFLNSMGAKGVSNLAAATPKRSSATANGWNYRIKRVSGGLTLEWYNTGHPEARVNVAILIQYGHGTRTGGYVKAIDYINPALKPVFDTISEHFMKGGLDG